MINIILNEKEYAEHAIKNNDIGYKPIRTLNSLARYYYSKGYRKGEIAGLLEEFMIKSNPEIIIVKWQKTIERIVSSVDKYPLINISGINITKSEIALVKKIDGVTKQRLMFTMICLAKYGNALNPNNNNWINIKDGDIFSLANITLTIKRQSLLINDLWRMKYIGYGNAIYSTNMFVRIIDDISPTELVITDFRNLGNQYRRYCGEKYFNCERCKLTIRRASNAQRYCKSCAVTINCEKTLEKYHNIV